MHVNAAFSTPLHTSVVIWIVQQLMLYTGSFFFLFVFSSVLVVCFFLEQLRTAAPPAPRPPTWRMGKWWEAAETSDWLKTLLIGCLQDRWSVEIQAVQQLGKASSKHWSALLEGHKMKIYLSPSSSWTLPHLEHSRQREWGSLNGSVMQQWENNRDSSRQGSCQSPLKQMVDLQILFFLF